MDITGIEGKRLQCQFFIILIESGDVILSQKTQSDFYFGFFQQVALIHD